MSENEITFGQKTVGISFNPSGLTKVDELKLNYANLIDVMNDLRDSTNNPVVKRLASEAITNTELACMWAVKALVNSVIK